MKGMHRGPLVIDRSGDVGGMIAGDVIVRAGVCATVGGMVSGDVVIEDGAQVRVTGMVAGRVVGSPVPVTGMIARR